MTAQADLFAPPVHRSGRATEVAASEKMSKSAERWRARVYGFAFDNGARGVTGWEACEHFGMTDHQSTVRTRLTELASARYGQLLTRRGTRLNANGNAEGVYAATSLLATKGAS